MKIVDMHCDTVSKILKRRRKGEQCGLRENDCHVDLQRMRKSGYLLQNFALFVDMDTCEDPWEEAMALLEIYEGEMRANSDCIAPVTTFDDIGRNEREGKLSALLTVEEGGVCRGELQKLHSLYGKGVRMLTLTWNYANELGSPNLQRALGKRAWGMHAELKGSGLTGEAWAKKQKEADIVLKSYLNSPNTRNGLTEKGKEFVSEMERLGMMIDVSHLSDAGFYDVLANTKEPFVASHSNARTICPCVRNLTDDMIRKLAGRGGVTGLNFCADFLVQKPAGESNPGIVADVVTHARHITNVGGMECLGLGSDFDGIDTHEELRGTENMGLLWDAMEKGGFLPSQLDKIFSGNVLRIYRERLQ